MQGNRTSEQQGKICLTHGARASAPTQVLTAQPGPRAHAPRPQPDRLPEPYIPTDEDLLQRIAQQPLLTFAELLLQLWPSLPYRALPGQDSATETKRRWPAPGGGAPRLLQTAAGWLRAQLRRLHRTGNLELQSYPDGVCYLPAGLALLHRPAPIRVLEYLTREEVDLCPTTGCISAPDDLDVDQPWAKVRVRRADQMTVVAYRSGAGTAQRIHKPLYSIGEHVAGPILVPSDADHPRIWRLCLVLTQGAAGVAAPARTATLRLLLRAPLKVPRILDGAPPSPSPCSPSKRPRPAPRRGGSPRSRRRFARGGDRAWIWCPSPRRPWPPCWTSAPTRGSTAARRSWRWVMRNPHCTALAEQRWMPWAQPILLKELADPPALIQERAVDAGDPPPDPALVIEMTEDEEGFMVVGQPGDHRPGTDDVGWTPPSTEGQPITPDDEGGDEDDENDDGILIVLSHDLPERQRPRPAAPPPVREFGAKEVAHG